jgi:phosphoribosylglycinamide formyltransferase-1
VRRFAGRILNIHPSLLPAFGGGMDALKAAFDARLEETGVTIHYIEPDTVDGGTIVAQEKVAILDGDTLASLEERVHAVEHHLYPATIQAWIEGRLPRPVTAGGAAERSQ